MIQTARCELTEMRSEDRQAFIRLHSDSRVREFLGGVQDMEVIERKFTDAIYHDFTRRNWVIRLKTDGSFIGMISLHPHHDEIDTELSYLLLPEWWGRGLATEAVQATIDYCKDKLKMKKLISETQCSNRNSIKLLERLGMKPERSLERFGAWQIIYANYLR